MAPPGPDRHQDPYQRLGVARTADAREIRRRYLELCARYHPDHHQDNPLGDLAAERVAEINAAYELLSNPATRAAYDAQLRSPPGSGTNSDNGAKRSPGQVVARLAVFAVGTLLGLRLIPPLGRVFGNVLATWPGRLIVLGLLASLTVIVILRFRARRSK